MPVKGLRVGFRSAMTEVEDSILLLGRQVQSMVGGAAASIRRPDPAVAGRIRRADDEVDERVAELDSRLYELLTLQGPVAADLRLLLSLQRVLASIERIGDGALNIARLTGSYAEHAMAPQLVQQLHELGLRSERAVRTGLDLFGHRQVTTEPLDVVERQINQLHHGLTARLIDHAVGSRAATEWSINMVLVSRHLERIGDHAMKIAREGGFVATGERLPRHTT
ncbi:phosphate signaling complex PhoU family protein [Euzebya tangerina]|uniref:phosphate signaling complex PhoU family protein n=1 Tax=Euzebya tangerina TaxID=591198 RepID=UPI0013C36DFA|nr:PhoU domain-containing protein [Euzebya tangerina]